MKAVIITQDEPFYIPKYLESIIRKKPEETDIIGIIALPPNLPGKSYIASVIYHLNFYGVTVFSYMVILRIFFKLSDIFKNFLGIKKNIHSVKKISEINRINHFYTKDINDEQVLRYLNRLAPDIILSLACPQRLKSEIINTAKKHTLNIHSSLLPLFKGVNANFWVLAKGCDITGVSIHIVDRDFDNGKIVEQKSIKIDKEWSMNDLYHKVIDQGSDLIAVLFKKISDGNELSFKDNETAKGSYYSFPKRKDVREFRKRKKRFFKIL